MSELPKDRSGEDMPEEKKIPYGGGFFIGDGDDSNSEPEDFYKPPKKERKVSLFTFVLTTVSLVLAAVMITYTVTSALNRPDDSNDNTIPPKLNEYVTAGYPFLLFSQIVDTYSLSESDPELRMEMALKAYIAATGDVYAYYYTPEEYAERERQDMGEKEGIGVTVIDYVAEIDGQSVSVLKITNVTSDSPAYKSGVQAGDLIYEVGSGSDKKTVNELGYDLAFSNLLGEIGTVAEFTVKRPDGAGGYTTEDFAIERAKFIAESVHHRVYSEDPTVGIVKILQFDYTTPQEFSADMNDLISKGCTKFVFDVRYNLGGEFRSIAAVLSYFLEEGDTIMRTEYKDGTNEIDTVKVETFSEDSHYYGCSVTKEDIGKYRREDFQFVVLCNRETASAAELFTATFRDYKLADIVGVKTYGKGCLQKLMDLTPYGYGVLKLTVAKYYSGANGGYNDGYDGVGITPDDVVELSPELANKNIYDISDAEDNQLQKALTHFK